MTADDREPMWDPDPQRREPRRREWLFLALALVPLAIGIVVILL